MKTYRILTVTALLLAFLINPLHLYANTASAETWELTEIARIGATSYYTGIKHTANGSYKSTVRITPPNGNIVKFIGRTGFLAAVGLAIKGLFGLVDYVMDPANNRVRITKETGLWMDFDREVIGSIATAGRHSCSKHHRNGGGGGPIVIDYTDTGFAYVKCNSGYGQIWVHKEEKILTYPQLANQIYKDAQAGQPEAIAAVGQVADALATPQTLATYWERNKQPLAKVNDEEKVSPQADALSKAHKSGQRYGGNCRPKDFNELEKNKKRYCDLQRSCKEYFSQTELRRTAYNAEQCAIARSIINNKCFAGGDRGHKTQEREAWNAVTNCFRILSR